MRVRVRARAGARGSGVKCQGSGSGFVESTHENGSLIEIQAAVPRPARQALADALLPAESVLPPAMQVH